MPHSDLYDLIMEDRLDEAKDWLLREGLEQTVLKGISNASYMDYLMRLEEYLSNRDIYLFGKQWDNAEVLLDKIRVDKFWVTVYLIVDKDTDLRGALRLMSGLENQNQVKKKNLEDGRIMLQMKILKRYLDNIEQENQEQAKAIAQKEVEE